MLKKWAIKKFIFIALMAALGTVISYFTTAINVITGIPLSSFLSPLILTIFFVLTALVIRKFGAVTLLGIIWGILVIPSPALGGPGLHKVPLMFAICLVFDIIFYIFRKREKLAVILASAVSVGLTPWLLLFIGTLMGLPGLEKTRELVWVMTLMGVVTAVIGALIAVFIYNKLKNKRAVRQISS